MCSLSMFLSVVILIIRLPDMEEKLRVIIGDRIEKLVLPSGIPPTVDELQNTVKKNFGFYEEFSFQYLDSEFGDYFTLHKTDQIEHKDTIKVVFAAPIILDLQQIDESLDISFGQQSTDSLSVSYAESAASNAESSAETASSGSTINNEAPQKDASRGQSSSPFRSLHMRLRCILKRQMKTTERMEHF